MGRGFAGRGKSDTADGARRPVLCFIGPLVGRTPGFVTTQGEILTDHFSAAGYSVISASSVLNRYGRLVDIVRTIILNLRRMDILLIQTYGGPSFVVEDVASFLGMLGRKRIVMVLRGGLIPQFMAKYPRWSRRVLRRAHALVAPSPYLQKAMSPYGLAAKVVPNLIHLDAYPYRHRSSLHPVIFWMRTFQPVWNPEMAVRVLARVRHERPDATMIMAGEDKYGLQQEVEDLARSLGVHGAIRFTGFLDMKGKATEGNRADLFLNTNRIDNMPVSVVEACAMGLPVVATAVGGMPDLLTDGETGLLVPDNDDAAMAGAVLRLLRDPVLAGRLSANGRMLAEACSWDSVRPCWEDVFREVMERQGKGGAQV